jgi:membrane-associated protein
MFDITSFIRGAGYAGVGAVVFAESGLLIGILLPGDSLLFTAGLLASQGHLEIIPLVAIITLAAILGDSTGYWFGKKFGRSIFARKESLLLTPDHIARAEHFFARWGKPTLILARFTPIIRTLTPILAGIGSMRYRTFLSYNIIGGIVWGVGMPLFGYVLGNTVPNIDRYLMPILVLIIFVSITPGLWQYLRIPENRQYVINRIRSLFS